MPKYIPLKWRWYAETGVAVCLDVESVEPYGNQIFLKGQGIILSDINKNVDNSSPILFDQVCMMNVQLPKKLQQKLERRFGWLWQVAIVGLHLTIYCFGFSSPERMHEKLRGTGGHYMFDVVLR